MKVGIVLLINHPINFQEINVYPEYLKELTEFELCFVNNQPQDYTIFLEQLGLFSEHLHVAHIKKTMNQQKAIKAGVRLLSSIPQVMFFSYYVLKPWENSLVKLIQKILEHRSGICELTRTSQTSMNNIRNIPEIDLSKCEGFNALSV